MRRGWLVQRLEPRCVMAADILGSALAESPWADDNDMEPIEEVPSLISSIRPVAPAEELPQATVFDEPDVELNIDRLDDVVDDIAVDERRDAPTEIVDLLRAQSIDLQLHQNATVVFTWDVSQLDQLFGSGDSLAIHVIYDVSRWQAPLFESTPTMLSLADQSVHIQIDIQPGNVDEGTLPQIFIKLTDPNSSEVNGGKWATEEFDWQAGLTSTTSIAATERWDFQGSKIDQVVVDSALGVNPADKGDAGYASTDNTKIGEESGAQPFSEGDSAPLPESRRESSDRSPRTARRTLDLRPTGTVSSMASLASRTAVTPDSLATQAAIAGVYESEPSTAAGPSRWLLDPKPARLQVATFLLSRSSGSGQTVAVRSEGTRLVDQPGQAPSGLEKKASMPTAQAESVSQHVVSQAPHVESASESGIDDTLTRVDERIEETHAELEEPVREIPVYASIVDRLLGSPVSLVAVLGLTAITRFAEPEELDGR